MSLFNVFKKEPKYDFSAPLDKKRKALSKITDEKTLQHIAECEDNRQIRLEALYKIQDDNILAHIVTSDIGSDGPYTSFSALDNYAIELIKDDEILHDIYMKSMTCLSSNGLRNISNDALLRDISNNATIECHRSYAQTILEKER